MSVHTKWQCTQDSGRHRMEPSPSLINYCTKQQYTQPFSEVCHNSKINGIEQTEVYTLRWQM